MLLRNLRGKLLSLRALLLIEGVEQQGVRGRGARSLEEGGVPPGGPTEVAGVVAVGAKEKGGGVEGRVEGREVRAGEARLMARGGEEERDGGGWREFVAGEARLVADVRLSTRQVVVLL